MRCVVQVNEGCAVYSVAHGKVVTEDRHSILHYSDECLSLFILLPYGFYFGIPIYRHPDQ